MLASLAFLSKTLDYVYYIRSHFFRTHGNGSALKFIKSSNRDYAVTCSEGYEKYLVRIFKPLKSKKKKLNF